MTRCRNTLTALIVSTLVSAGLAGGLDAGPALSAEQPVVASGEYLASGAASESGRRQVEDEQVRAIIISVDGLRPDAIDEDVSPTMFTLAQAGAFSWKAQTIVPSNTLPSHSSMLSGVDVDEHQITWNDYRPEHGSIETPTVLSIAHDAGLRTMMVIGKEKLRHLVIPDSVDELFLVGSGPDLDVVSAGLELVEGGAFDLLFVHLPHVDRTGHASGWMSEPYLEAVTDADTAINLLLEAVETAGLTDSTVVIITADHGGRGTGHGADIPEHRTIPWIIAGPGVPAGGELEAEIRTMDTAATALYLLGLDIPETWAGQPVLEAFDVDALAAASGDPAGEGGDD